MRNLSKIIHDFKVWFKKIFGTEEEKKSLIQKGWMEKFVYFPTKTLDGSYSFLEEVEVKYFISNFRKKTLIVKGINEHKISSKMSLKRAERKIGSEKNLEVPAFYDYSAYFQTKKGKKQLENILKAFNKMKSG